MGGRVIERTQLEWVATTLLKKVENDVDSIAVPHRVVHSSPDAVLTRQLEGRQRVGDPLRVEVPSEGEGPRREGERVKSLIPWNIPEHSTEKWKQPKFKIRAGPIFIYFF